MSRNVIQMKRLGRYGRFGNQIFQYMFLRTYARRNNLSVQVPVWKGTYLFGTKDKTPCALPTIKEERVYDAEKSRIIGRRGVNVEGYFQYHTSYYAQDKEFIREIFTPTEEVKSIVNIPVEALRAKGKTLVGLHIRMGDHGRRSKKYVPYFATPVDWCKKWLDEHLPNMDEPVLYLASDEPDKVLSYFSSYNPMVALPNLIPGVPEYQDFYVMSKCDVLLIASSSYSFAASMLNTGKQFYRPNPKVGGFVKYDPWNDYSILR
jgi:hypothetical protein